MTPISDSVHPLIANRLSSRDYDTNASIGRESITAILDAARWAPTWGGQQPIRFLVGIRHKQSESGQQSTFDALAATLTEGNAWAKHAAAFVLVAAPEGKWPAVDAGLATGQLILQAEAQGFNAHPMAGFDAEAAATLVTAHWPEHSALLIVAIGKVPESPSPGAPTPKERRRLPLAEVAIVE